MAVDSWEDAGPASLAGEPAGWAGHKPSHPLLQGALSGETAAIKSLELI